MTENNNHHELMVEHNADFFVTHTTMKSGVSLERLIDILQARETTGDLTIHFNEGGIRKIELKEWTKPSKKDGARIREILDME